MYTVFYIKQFVYGCVCSHRCVTCVTEKISYYYVMDVIKGKITCKYNLRIPFMARRAIPMIAFPRVRTIYICLWPLT